MEWQLSVLFFTTVVVGFIRRDNDVLDVLNYLKALYRQNDNEGCGTEIKCKLPEKITNGLVSNYSDGGYMTPLPGNSTHGGYMTPLPGNSTHGGYNCCYDCSGSCKDRPRCYQGWQCCKQKDLQREANEMIPKHDYLTYFVTCEHTLMHNVHSQSESYQDEIKKVSYNMISKCPLDYHDKETIEKCTTQTSMLPILERIPYISTTTMYVFKNIHCVRCHSLLYNEIVPFSLSVHEITHYGRRINGLSIITNFETVLDMIAFIAPSNSSNYGHFGKVFITALPEHISSYSKLLPKPCFKDGLEIRTVETIGGIYWSYISRACEMFNFPITVYNNQRSPKTFKNLACAIRANIAPVTAPGASLFRVVPQPACTLEDYKDPRLIVNIQPALDLTNELNQLAKNITTVKASDNITNQLSNNISDIEYHLDIEYPTPGGQKTCPNGFFMDSYQNRCRKILCQKRFYIYKGKCVPAYLETIRHSYLTAVKVSPSNPKLYINKRKFTSIKKKILETIPKITDLKMCRSYIFLKESVNKIEYILFKVLLTPSYDTARYLDMMNRMSNVYRESLYRKHDTSGTLLGLTITSGSDIYTDTHWYESGMAFDTTDGVELTVLQAPFDYSICGDILSVTPQAYCLRVTMSPEEFTLINDPAGAAMDVVVINSTGKMMYPNKYELSNNGHVRVCISDYLPKRGSKREPTNTIVKQGLATENELIDTYINIGLGVLVVMVIAAIVYLHISKKRSLQPHNA